MVGLPDSVVATMIVPSVDGLTGTVAGVRRGIGSVICALIVATRKGCDIVKPVITMWQSQVLPAGRFFGFEIAKVFFTRSWME
jgi:hypothetical protein